MMWVFVALALILTLALGLSIGGLVIGYRQGLWENIARYFLVGLLGVAISALSLVLIVIAVWPPYDVMSFVLPFGFIAIVLGVLHFVRSTNTVSIEEEELETEESALISPLRNIETG